VPVKERPDIDRWILSDLQLLVRRARESFEGFGVQAFCLDAERFVDDRLSNWYVRRNRRRFWKSEKGADKTAAYQTLYAVLTALAKLFAPVMPFLSEEMYQNLVIRGGGRGAPESVHHCEFPSPDEGLIDSALSADMAATLRLVSLGSSARNKAKIKVRQPLSGIKACGAIAVQKAVERFGTQICDELNVKSVVAVSDTEFASLIKVTQKANPRTVGPKYPGRMQEINQALASLISSGKRQASYLDAANNPVPADLKLSNGDIIQLDQADIIADAIPPEGWIYVQSDGTELMLDSRITEPLKLEGMAREIVRLIQELRKKAGLEMDDRIVLFLGTESPVLRTAIAAHKDNICAETLTVERATQPLGEGAFTANVKVEGQPLRIELRKSNRDDKSDQAVR
jgi:isoleucyl-tRNA synthetase